VITQAELDAQTAAAEAAAAAQAVAEAAQAAAEAAQAAAEASLDAALNPSPVSLAMTTSTDILLGTTSDDTFTGSTATYANTDVISDSSTTDSDTFTFTATADDDLDGSIVNIENVVVNIDAFTTAGTAASWESNVAGIASGTNVAIDVVKAGSSVSASTLTNVDSITVTASTAILDLTLTTDADSDVTVVSNYVGADEFDLVIAAAAAQMDTLTVTSADDLHIVDTAGDEVAELITATSAGDIEVSATGVAAVNLTAANEVVVTDAAAATTVTISANGTGAGTTTESSVVLASAIETLNVSGNGGALHVDAVTGSDTDTLSTINFSGDQNVTVELTGANHQTLANRLTATDSSTATSRIEFSTASTANLNVTQLAVDEIELAADFAGETITVASGATLVVSANQGVAPVITSALATASTNTLNMDITDNLTTTDTATGNAATRTISDIDLDNFSAVNISLTDNLSLTAAGGLEASGAALTFTGSGTLVNTTGDDITATSLDASAMTSAATLFLSGNTGTVSTGAAGDSITLEAVRAAGYNITTNAGSDTVNMAAIDTSITFNGGDGTDTLTLVSTLDLSGQTFALTSVEVVDIDLSGDAASTLTVDSAQVTGKTFSVIATEGTTNDILDVTVNAATVDLSGIAVETDDVTVTVDGTAFTTAVSTTVTGTNGVDTININGGVGSTANGGGSGDTITGGAGADTINGDGGGDTLVGAGGADTITGGAGADTITAGNGADTINLAETTAARDIVVTTSGLTAKDTINDFAAGSAATTDEVDIDISDVTALATQLVNLDDTANHAGIAGNAITSTVTGAFDADNLTANTDILILGGALTFSSSAALADALEDGGTAEFTLGGAAVVGDVFMVLYSDGTNTHLSAVEALGAGADNGTFSAGELQANDILTFSGIADASDFAATNFDFIA